MFFLLDKTMLNILYLFKCIRFSLLLLFIIKMSSKILADFINWPLSAPPKQKTLGPPLQISTIDWGIYTQKNVSNYHIHDTTHELMTLVPRPGLNSSVGHLWAEWIHYRDWIHQWATFSLSWTRISIDSRAHSQILQ